MKNIIIILFCIAICSTASAQNIFIKPFVGSGFGFSSVENQIKSENLDVYSLNAPTHWRPNAYYGLSVEWQKDTKNRFELYFSTHELALGQQSDYTSSVTGNISTFRQYTRKPSLNIAFNYGRNLASIGLKTGKKFSFDGIVGASFIRKRDLDNYVISARGGLQGFYTVEIDDTRNVAPSFGLNLGFATRLHNRKGNAVLELRFQYIKSFVEMNYQTTKYNIDGQEFEFRQSSNGSMINFAFGIPIRVLSTDKK